MYKFFKIILLSLLPKTILKKIEFPLRKVYALLYAGDKVFCVVCEKHFSKFQPINNNDSLCMHCGSIPRQRLLMTVLKKNNLIHKKTLHFSPNRFFAHKMHSLNHNYFSTDFNATSDTDFHYDITQLNVADNSYDLIICYHVLEHIVEDLNAMSELYRILSKNGILICQVPFSQNGETIEDETITSPSERLKKFGQEDHVRIYGIQEFTARLSSAGFNIKTKKSSEIADLETMKKHGLNPKEVVIICSK